MSPVSPERPSPPGATLIGITGRLVPAERRREWCAEWLGELDHAWNERPGAHAGDWHLRLRLLARCAGSVPDALWMRRRHHGGQDMLGHDLRYALRILAKRPGFTVIIVLTLALGIGANTAIFSVVDGVLLRPSPFEDADQLAMVWETDRKSGTTREPASVPDYLDFRERSARFEEMAAFQGFVLNLTLDDAEPARLAALAVTREFLPMVGISPLLGRNFTAEEDQPGGPEVALVSEALWQRLFSGDPRVLGRTLRLNDVQVSIIGVLPSDADFGSLQILSAAAYARGFADRGGPTAVDVWVPYRANPESTPRSTHPIFVLGRLAQGSSIEAAQQEMSTIAADLERAYPENDSRGVFVERLSDVVFGTARPALLVLMGAVLLVLLVACGNVANLLLARGTTRMREVAVRTALGASAGGLARQFLVESVLVTLAAAMLGVLLAFGGLELLLALAPASTPRLSAVGIDERVLGATLGVSVLVGLTFGMIPTLQARRVDLQSSLASEALNASPGRERGRLRSALVVAELAMAVVLLVGAGLLIKSFWRLQHIDPGFQAAGVLKAEFQLPRSRYPVSFAVWPNLQEIHRFNDALLARAASLPGVEAAAIARNHPLDAGSTNSFVVIGREAESSDFPEVSVRSVTPGYFRTVALPLRRGRLLEGSDRVSSSAVLVINEAAARRFFPQQDPIGQQMAFWGTARTIVGIVGDERMHGLPEAPPPAVYGPLAQLPPVNGAETLLLRTRGNAASLAAAARTVIRETDPALAVFGVEPLSRTISASLAQRRFTTLLLGLFAGMAIVLAMVGVHGVLSYAVAQRAREIGIRIALGAERGDVRRLVLEQGVVLAAAGLALGVALALVLTRTLSSLLYGVRATDPATFAVVTLLLGAVALLASYLPARRASEMDPVEVMRG